MKKLYSLLILFCLAAPSLVLAQRPTNLTGWLVYSRSGSPYGSVWASDLHNRHLLLVDSAQIARVSSDGGFLYYIRQNGNPNVNQTGTVARMDMRTGAKANIFSFGDWTVGYDMALADSSAIIGYSCGMYKQDFAQTTFTPIFQSDCYDDAPDLRQRDSLLVHHKANKSIKLFNMGHSSLGNGIIPGSRPGDYWPQWSPDGQWILFGRAGITNPDPYRSIGNLYKVRPDGSELTHLTHYLATDTNRLGQNFAWSQDGSQVYVAAVLGPNQPWGIYAIKSDSSADMATVLMVPNATISFLHGKPASTVAVRPTLKTQPLTIWPNPASGNVSIDLPKAAGAGIEVRLLDAIGRVIMKKEAANTGTISLSIQDLKAGCYLAQAITSKGIWQGKLQVE